jgi:hypothetical protein
MYGSLGLAPVGPVSMDEEEQLKELVARWRDALRSRPPADRGGRSATPTDPATMLQDVHREHVAGLLEAALRDRIELGALGPYLAPAEAVRLGGSVARWGLESEVELLCAPASLERDRRIAEALLRLSPTAARRELAARLDSLGEQPGPDRP